MFKLTDENYYSPEADKHFFSFSQIKGFMRCEAAEMAKLSGEYKSQITPAIEEGSIIDACLLGTEKETDDAFDAIHTKPAAVKRRLLAMAMKARNDEYFSSFLRDNTFIENQRIFTGEIGGAMFKAKFDAYFPGSFICDLKTTSRPREAIYNTHFNSFYRYDLQLAIYQQLEGNQLPCYIAAITNSDDPELILARFRQETLDNALEELIQTHIPRYKMVKEGLVPPIRCEECDYCKYSYKLTKDDIAII